MVPAYMKLTKSDADICRAFQNVVKQGKFEIQGEAAQKVGLLFKWFSELDKRIEETIKDPPAPPVIRQLTEGELAAHKKAKK